VNVRQTERAQSAEEFFSRLLAHADAQKEPDTPSEPAKITRNLDGIQNFALGNYKKPMVGQVLLKAGVPPRAIARLARLVSGRKDT
jgi:hypothetical protein